MSRTHLNDNCYGSNRSSLSATTDSTGSRFSTYNNSVSDLDKRRSAISFPSLESPDTAWTPFCEELQGDDYLSKALEMNAFSAFESLHMDDFLNNEIGSSSSSTSSEYNRNPSSSLHNLPAWSSCEDEETLRNHLSPAFSDAPEDNKVVNDVWFAPTTSLSRKKRINFGQEREVSPGAAAANLKSHKSAPQLIQRVPSIDHQAKLEELLVEMGWPRESSSSTKQATDGEEGNNGNVSQSIQSGSSGATRSSGHSISAGAGSLASGMPATSALFKRRADMREGEMPKPSPVAIPNGEEMGQLSIPATSGPHHSTFDQNLHLDTQLLHSRSATFPVTYDSFSSLAARQGPTSVPVYSTLYSNLVSPPNPPQHNTVQNVNESGLEDIPLMYGMESRREAFNQDRLNSSPDKRPSSASTGSTGTELRTPITPFQALTTSDVSSLPYDFQMPNVASDFSAQMLSSGFRGQSPQKMKSLLDLQSSLNSNSINHTNNLLGLQNLQTVNNSRIDPYPAMIDSSAYSQIFAHMPSSVAVTSTPFPHQRTSSSSSSKQQQQQQHSPRNLKQMRSSPDMRTSPPSDNSASSSTKQIRKIASNRRLTVSSSNISNENVVPKSPMKKGKSPKSLATFALPPMPTSSPLQYQRPRSATSAALMSGGGGGGGGVNSIGVGSGGSKGSTFQFVNYGVDDADELCSAVAPSGSYKVPLKGFGANDEDDEDDEVEEEKAATSGSRSRSKSNLNTSTSSGRLGPRWQGLDDGEEDNNNNEVSQISLEEAAARLTSNDEKSRQIKRRKSEASMTTLSGKRKTASSGNLKRRD